MQASEKATESHFELESTGQALEGRLAGHEFVHTCLEPALTDLAELEAEAPQDAPQA